MLGIEVLHLKGLRNYIVVKRNMAPTITTAVHSRPCDKFLHQQTISAPNTNLCQPKSPKQEKQKIINTETESFKNGNPIQSTILQDQNKEERQVKTLLTHSNLSDDPKVCSQKKERKKHKNTKSGVSVQDQTRVNYKVVE